MNKKVAILEGTAPFVITYETLSKNPKMPSNELPASVADAVLVSSTKLPADTPIVRGYDFNQGVDFPALLRSYKHMGFQATNLALAMDEINRMVAFFTHFKRLTG